MKVLILPRYSRKGASSRLRTYQFIPYLKQHGMDVEVSCLFDDQYLDRLYSAKQKNIYQIVCAYLKRFEKLFCIRKYDVIWIENELFPYMPSFFEWFLARIGVSYIVDYDDAIFHYYDQHRLRIARFFLGSKITSVMRNASCVTVGNDYLASYAYSSAAKCVKVLPTVIDIKRYTLREYKKPEGSSEVIIGWIGSPGSQDLLRPYLPYFKKIYENMNVKFVFVGAKSFGDIGFPIDYIEWSEDTEVESICTFDVGIMPLMNTPWQNGKCGYKLIQYQACCKPVVASPVGVNKTIVKHGETGYLAGDFSDWGKYLEILVNDVELRHKMGESGRRLVENSFTLQVVSPLLLEVLQGGYKNG